ncbi:glutamine amidotransferase [Paenibacillus sp. H1-7]|uniref:type 1 glutamine amidotransferase family protein n=1 Tax=Paenibacillus sp. H1-7 TaxID=2282849 RepID=UPI001EF8022F|nr:type 1 glutamine amidotransferase family protein [Paenibacillus sp. H1-7]ULL14028.1 glutamine amidotransferase [Paenibacillus sp. H1-7]
MEKQVLVFITDGFADWEASYITTELNSPETGYRVKTIAIDKQPKVSMGGLRVLPDYDLADHPSLAEIAMLIIPGGTGWREEHNQQASRIVAQCVEHDVPIAAICDATTFLANHGFLENNKHTGNMLETMKEGAPNYRGDRLYVHAQSVSDGNVITANGSAAVEFSRHILERLGVMQGEQLEQWYDIFKKGYIQQ